MLEEMVGNNLEIFSVPCLEPVGIRIIPEEVGNGLEILVSKSLSNSSEHCLNFWRDQESSHRYVQSVSIFFGTASRGIKPMISTVIVVFFSSYYTCTFPQYAV